MPYLDPTNFSEGPVFLLIGHASNHLTPDVLPSDATPFIVAGGSWGGSWEIVGFTDENGLSHEGLSPDVTNQMTAQQRGPASTVRGNASQAVTANLLEMSAARMQQFLGYGEITSTGTSDELLLTDDDALAEYAIGVEAFGPKGKPLRILYPRTTPQITGAIVNRIGQNAVVPVRFTRTGYTDGQPRWRFIK
jgi:hypothetical protein